ncbi:MAG: PD-(D/E)XK nuclease family protein [bacterium]|nr:PD-(D/E)XK nuclease family protein [bacterium]
MSFNPNAVFISPSSFADFTKCPQLYYYRYVYRSPRGLKIQLITPHLALGQAVHDTLEPVVHLPAKERSKDHLFSRFNFSWGNISGEKGGFSSAEEEKLFQERATRMLERFWTNEHFKATESVHLPEFPKVDLGNDLILTGKLDWLEKEGEGYHLVDFKTGKNEERDTSLQLPIYAVLVADLFKTSAIKASYWYLDNNEEIVGFALPDLKETKEKLRTKGEIIKMVRQTRSFRCQSGGESCWACQDYLAIAQGKGKLVSMDPVNRKQEIYILPKEIVNENTLPF